jgi:hypothetical protein
VFPTGSVPRFYNREKSWFRVVNGGVWRLPEPSDSKIWSWVLWDSEPRITVLARASSNSTVSPEWHLVSEVPLLTRCHVFSDCRRGWIGNWIYWITVYTLQFITVHFTLFPLGRVSSRLGPGPPADPTLNLQLCTLFSTALNWLLNCCWPSPAQWFLVPSPTGLMTVFYSLTALGAFRHPRWLLWMWVSEWVWVNELRPTVSRSVCLGVEPHLGLTTRY